jgi:hypothetical protein
MAKDDYFRIVYVILRELYRCKKAGLRMDIEQLKPEALGIHESYRNDILEGLLDQGYATGYKCKRYINGRAFKDLEDIDITPEGIRYLDENSMMRKVMEWAKTAKEIAPNI